MKFKSNARWNEPKENGTIFELKDTELRISIHRIIYCEKTWFLNCYALNISDMNLRENDFETAVKKAKSIIRSRIQKLKNECNKFLEDKVIEIE